MSSVTSLSKMAKFAGVSTAVLVTASASWTLAASLCHGIDGKIVGFGLMCEAPACQPQSIFSILPPHQMLITALLMLIFLGIPIGLLAYTTVGRWQKPLPPR
jgi:ABC-type antimicrobial peptide transport system permease subunit